MSTVSTERSTASTASAACAIAAALLIVTAVVFRWSGQPTVVGIALGVALLLCAMAWRTKDGAPRLTPTFTMLIGMALVVAPPVLDYNDGQDGDPIAVAYAVHMLTGLALAAVGYWSGKRLGTPRVDQL